MSDHPDAEISLRDKTQHLQQTDIRAPNGIRIRNPSNERPQTYALYRAATGIEENIALWFHFLRDYQGLLENAIHVTQRIDLETSLLSVIISYLPVRRQQI